MGLTLESHGPPPHNTPARKKSTKSKTVYEFSPLSIDPIWPGIQQDQGHGVDLHDQVEDYQQPITYRIGSESRQASTYECWRSVQQVLRPHHFTNVGSFWNSWPNTIFWAWPYLVFFFLSRILRKFLVAAANVLTASTHHSLYFWERNWERE